MRAARASLAVAAAIAAGAILVSGGSDADPRTPPALPGLPPPFLGTTVTGDGGTTAALDAYGDVVDLYAPGPAGTALIDNPSARQAAGTVSSDTGIVPRVRIADGPSLPLWRADSVRQRYLPGTNVVRTAASFGAVRVVETAAARGGALAVVVRVGTGRRASAGVVGTGRRASAKVDGAGRRAGAKVDGTGRDGAGKVARAGRGGGASGGSRSRDRASLSVHVSPLLSCTRGRSGDAVALVCGGDRPGTPASNAGAISSAAGRPPQSPRVVRAARSLIDASASADRRWLARARALGAGAPPWVRSMYRRSLLTLRALTARSGAAAAGAREGWSYVWPRDAATASLAFAAAGYRREAERVARFLARLQVGAAARFDEAGRPVPGRGPQGDEAGWVAAAARATGLPHPAGTPAWRGLPDYQEGSPGTFLGNAIAAASIRDPLASKGPTRARSSFARHRLTKDDRDTGGGDQGTLRDDAGARAESGRPGVGTRLGGGLGGAAIRVAGALPAGATDAAGARIAGYAVRDHPRRRLERRRGPLDRADRLERLGPRRPRPRGVVREREPRSPGARGRSGGSLAPPGDRGRDGKGLVPAGGRGREVRGLVPAGGRGRDGEPLPAAAHGSLTDGGTRRAEADRRAALALLADLRRAATPAGALPERVDARTGIARSTTPLLWSHAFAVLALRELWP